MLDEQKVADIVSRVLTRLQEKGIGAPTETPAATTEAAPAKSDCWQRKPLKNNDRPVRKKYSLPLSVSEKPQSPTPLSPSGRGAGGEGESGTAAGSPSVSTRSSIPGLYDNVDAAVKAADAAQQKFQALGFSARFKIIDAFRKCALENLERWSHEAVAETKMGRAEDKIIKNRLVTLRTPGPEILHKPDAFNGSDGLTSTRLDPFGVIASIIPCTNSTETVINNGISMLSGGNAVVFNPHPIAKKVSADAVKTLNEAIVAAGGPSELMCCLAEPTIETANELMKHPLAKLVLVTGGGAVVEAAMKSGKRAICAGPGNPPAVVDETANLEYAARAIVLGASLDNNVVCTDEKEVLAVDSIADELKSLMLKNGCVELKGKDIDRLTDLVLVPHGSAGILPAVPPASRRQSPSGGEDAATTAGGTPALHFAPCKNFVGKNPSHILRELGIQIDDAVRLILVDVDKNHPLVWTEQLMPVLPLCRLKDADEAMAHAAAVEAGRRHTASIHSQRIDRITYFTNLMNCSILVANDSNYAGLAENGEGYTSFSIATPTGEGLTTARTFCRERRLSICKGGLARK